MQKKILILLSSIIIIMVSWTVFVYAYVETNSINVMAEDGIITEGENYWILFLENTKKGRSDSISVMVNHNDTSYKAVIKYANGLYTYSDENGNICKNTHLLDVYGEWPGSDSGVIDRMIVLTDDEYTFEELALSVLSSNSDDIIEFEILFK